MKRVQSSQLQQRRTTPSVRKKALNNRPFPTSSARQTGHTYLLCLLLCADNPPPGCVIRRRNSVPNRIVSYSAVQKYSCTRKESASRYFGMIHRMLFSSSSALSVVWCGVVVGTGLVSRFAFCISTFNTRNKPVCIYFFSVSKTTAVLGVYCCCSCCCYC